MHPARTALAATLIALSPACSFAGVSEYNRDQDAAYQQGYAAGKSGK